MADSEELFPPIAHDVVEEPAQEEPAAPVETQEAKHEDQQVPLAALKEVRSENKTLKQRLSDIEQLLRQKEQPQAPDPLLDPEAHSAFLIRQFQEGQANVLAEMSERFARNSYGDELVDEAFEAAQRSGVVEKFRGSKDPWGDLAKWHKAEKAKAEIGDDPTAYKERLKAELLAELKAETAGRSVQPPASLAGQSNLSSSTPAWAGPVALDDLLGTSKKGF